MLSARRCKVFGPRFRGEEQILQVRPGHPLQSPPLLDGKEHGGFHSPFGNDLRPFREGGIEQLAEPRLGVLDRSSLAHGSLHVKGAVPFARTAASTAQ